MSPLFKVTPLSALWCKSIRLKSPMIGELHMLFFQTSPKSKSLTAAALGTTQEPNTPSPKWLSPLGTIAVVSYYLAQPRPEKRERKKRGKSLESFSLVTPPAPPLPPPLAESRLFGRETDHMCVIGRCPFDRPQLRVHRIIVLKNFVTIV